MGYVDDRALSAASRRPTPSSSNLGTLRRELLPKPHEPCTTTRLVDDPETGRSLRVLVV